MADQNNSGTADGANAKPQTDADLHPAQRDVTFQPAESLKPAGNDSLAAADAPRRGAKQTIKDEAGKLSHQAAEKARGFADQGKSKATGALDEFSKMIDDAAGTVDERLGENYGQYARSAAGAVSGFADSLRGKEIDDLIDEARQFVRKSPVIAIGTAAALGFVLARVIKSGIDGADDTGKA